MIKNLKILSIIFIFIVSMAFISKTFAVDMDINETDTQNTSNSTSNTNNSSNSNTTNISNREIIELSDTYVNVGKELNINPSNVDKYLWEVGNSYCNKKSCEECPLNNICAKQNNLINM